MLRFVSLLLLSRGVVGAPTVLALQGPHDFVDAAGHPLPTGANSGASITNNAPFGVAIRSGAPSRPNTIAAVAVPLAPGVTVESVSFGYRYCEGYATTGAGPNFTLSVAGAAAFKSGPLALFPYQKSCPAGNCYSPVANASASSLAIKVPADGVQRIAFEFHNTDQNLQLLLPMTLSLTCSPGPCVATPPPTPKITTWHVVWTGGQSNAVGTNSQTSGYPAWPTTSRIQMFCWSGYPTCTEGTFAPAAVPLYGESNVAFSQTFANLLLQTLPADHGVVTLNTGVGGTGFIDNRWTAPGGDLAVQSVAAVKKLAAALPAALGGTYHLHAMLWHQGEEDAQDNRKHFNASYCQYLVKDLSPLVDFLRQSFPGASAATPFVDGGLLPYWVDKEAPATAGVSDALYALNTSRPFTGTADSRIFTDFFPGTTIPNGDHIHKSGVTHDVIHFNATQATLMGHQYWGAYQRAIKLGAVVPSARTAACGKTPTPAVTLEKSTDLMKQRT